MAVQVYHGSDADFNTFEFDFIGTSHGLDAGFGFYFSESKADAITYGPILYTCLLNLKTEVSNEKVTLNAKQVAQILDRLEEFDCGDGLTKSYYENFDYDKEEAINSLLDSCESDTEIIGDIINACGALEAMMTIMPQLGFTHTTDSKTPELETVKHYIVYDPSIIAIIAKDPILV